MNLNTDLRGYPCLKLMRAKHILGERYVLHPANRVKKIPPPIPAFLDRRPRA
jgi:hypothetical protein